MLFDTRNIKTVHGPQVIPTGRAGNCEYCGKEVCFEHTDRYVVMMFGEIIFVSHATCYVEKLKMLKLMSIKTKEAPKCEKLEQKQ